MTSIETVPSGDGIVFTEVTDHLLTEELLKLKAPELIERFREAIKKLPDFKRAPSDDFFDHKLAGGVSFRKRWGLYTAAVSQDQMVITKKEVGDIRQEAFEKTTITQGGLGEHILFERTTDGKHIDPWPDTEQGYDNALTMLVGLMEPMDVMTQFATGKDFPRYGRVQRPSYEYKPTNP